MPNLNIPAKTPNPNANIGAVRQSTAPSSKQTSNQSSYSVQRGAVRNPNAKSSFVLTHNGNSVSISQDQVDWIRDRYQKSYTDYYKNTGNDLDNMLTGSMPKSFATSYSNSQLDKQLLDLGLPSTKFLGKYMIDYDEWYGDGAQYQFDDSAKEYIKNQYKKSWTYNYTKEDQERKAKGLPPAALASKYKDSFTDSDLYERGLPPSSDLTDYIGKYENYVNNNARIYGFYDAVAQDIFAAGGSKLDDSQKSQIFFNKLESPEWADVLTLYKDTRRPDEISETDFTTALGLPDTESYREARVKAIKDQEELESSGDPYASYSKFISLYSDAEKAMRKNAVVDSAISAYEQKTAPAGEYSKIVDRKSAFAYVDALPEGYDPVAVLNDLYQNGVDMDGVRRASNRMKTNAPDKETKDKIKEAYQNLLYEEENGKAETGTQDMATVGKKLASGLTLMSEGNTSAAKSLNEAAAQDSSEIVSRSKRAKEVRKNLVAEITDAYYNKDLFTTVPKDKAIATYKSYAKDADGNGVIDADDVEAAKQALASLGLNNREIGLVEDEVDAEKRSGVGNALLKLLFPDVATEQTVERDNRNLYAAEAYQKRLMTNAGKGEAEDMKEILSVARAKLVDSGKMNPFEFDQAARQEGYSSLLDPEEQTKNYYVYVEAANSGATPEQAIATWDSMDDSTKKELTQNFVVSSFTNPNVAKTDAEVLAYQGFGSIPAKAAAGIISGTVSFADMVASTFGKRTDQWQFTKDVNEFAANVQNMGRSNQNLFTQGVSFGSDIGAELLKMYALNEAGSAVSGAFGATKAGATLAATAASKTASKGAKLLSGLALHTIQSTPFMMNAAGQYYTEAVQGGATMEQARVYGTLLGGFEGMVEAFNTDKIWGKVFGAEKIGQSIVKDATKTLGGKMVAKARLLSLVTSFLGEYGEESVGYAASLAAGALQGWNKDKFSWSEFNAQGLMGGLIGIIGGSAQISNISEASLVGDYMIKSGDYSADNYDILLAAAFKDKTSSDQIENYRALGSDAILSKEQHAAVVGDIVQASKDYHAASSNYSARMKEIDSTYNSKKRAITKAKKYFDLLDQSGVDHASDEFNLARAELLKAGTPEELSAEREKALKEAENDYASSIFTSTRALEKASEKLRAHNVVLASEFQVEINAMKRAADAMDVDSVGYKKYLESVRSIDSAMLSDAPIDEKAYAKLIWSAGDAINAGTVVTQENKTVSSVLSNMSAKLKEFRAGRAKEVFEREAATAETIANEPVQNASLEPSVLSTDQQAAEPVSEETVQKKIVLAPLSDADKAYIQSKAERIGRSVEFAPMEDWADAKYENGKVILNENQRFEEGEASVAQATLRKLFVHEMTHSIQGTVQFNDLSEFAIKQMEAATGMDRESLYAATQDLYYKSSNGAVKLGVSEARAEIVARYAENHFLTDEASINKLVREQSGVAGRFLNWIQYQIAKIGARLSGDKEAVMLLDAERLYLKAFSATKANPSTYTKENYEPVPQEEPVQKQEEPVPVDSSVPTDVSIEPVLESAPVEQVPSVEPEPSAQQATAEEPSAETVPESAPVDFAEMRKQESAKEAELASIAEKYKPLEGELFYRKDPVYAKQADARIKALIDASSDKAQAKYILSSNQYGKYANLAFTNESLEGAAMWYERAFISYEKGEGIYTSKEVSEYAKWMQSEVNRMYETSVSKYGFGAISEGKKLRPDVQVRSATIARAYEISHDLMGLYGNLDQRLSAANSMLSELEAPESSDVLYSISDGQGTPFEEALKKYGQKAQGMNPRSREAAVPNKVGTDENVSDFVRSVLESDLVPDDQMVTDLEQAVVAGDIGVYARTSNAETREEAIKKITDYGGVTKAMEYFKNSIKDRNVNVFNGARMVALGEQLLGEAVKEKNVKAQIDLITDLCLLATESGRTTQAFAMLKLTGGLGRAFYMEKMIGRLNDKYFGKVNPSGMEPVSAQDALLGTNSNRIKIDTALFDALSNAKNENEIFVAEDAILKQVGEQIPLTTAQALSNWRYFSMLANPITHIRNMTGNAIMGGVSRVKDVVAAGIEKKFLPEEERTKATYSRAESQKEIALAESLFDKYAGDITRGGKFGLESELRKYQRQSNVKSVDTLMKWNSAALEAEDMRAMKRNFTHSFVMYMKAQNIDPRTMTEEQEAEAAKIAINEARTNTFREDTAIAGIMKTISDSGWLGQLVSEGILPFKKTPVNILKQGVRYSPLGLAQGIYMQFEGVKSGKNTPAQAIDRISSGIVGSALFGLGVVLARIGLLRGAGEDDENAESYLASTGEQKYSLNIGDLSIGMTNIPPATIPLFMGVALYEGFVKDGEMSLGDVADMISGVANPMMEMSFLASLNNALKSYNTGAGGNLGAVFGNAALSYASQYIPTIGGKIAQFSDPTVRTAKASKASPIGTSLDYWARSQAKKVPILENQLEPNVDQLGRTSVKSSFGDWALDFFSKFVLPVSVKVKSKDSIDKELISVFEQTGNSDAIPVLPQKYFTVNGKQYPLTAKQYTQYSEDYGQRVYKAIGALFMTSSYQNATDDNKALMIKKVIETAEKSAREEWKFDIVQEGND